MRGRGTINTVLTLAAVGIAVFGVVGINKWFNQRRIKLIEEFGGFDPNYQYSHNVTITHERAKILADQIYNAGGLINDDEGAILSALSESGTKANLSRVSHYFAQRHSQSMGDYITWYMDDKSETKQLIDVLQKLK
jgi:hypothetical protein